MHLWWNFLVWPKWFPKLEIALIRPQTACIFSFNLARVQPEDWGCWERQNSKTSNTPHSSHSSWSALSCGGKVYHNFLGLNVCTAAQGLIRESENIWVFYPLMSPDGGAFRNLPTAKWSKRYFPVKSSYLQQNSQMGDKSLWVLLSYLWSGNLILIIFQLFSFKFWLLCFSIMWNWLDLLIAVLARPNILFQLFS